MSCRTSNCCDPNPFVHQSDAPPVTDDTCDYGGGEDHPNCSDPDFAAANPGLCLNSPRLILKPEYAVVQVLQDVRYHTFLWANGVETELLTDVIYTVDSTAIALIGVSSGNATGVSVGITTVNAAWGGMTAIAQIEVIADCATRVNHFLFLHDVSYSMTGEFNGTYATLMDFSKFVGTHFANHTDWTKDEAAVMEFDVTGRADQAFTQDLPSVTDAIAALAAGTATTYLKVALENAAQYFDDQAIDTSGRVILLFSDGNNKGGDPIPVADALRAAGCIILVVGLRATGDGFRLLDRIASGGFFINAKDDNYASVTDWLNGMRSYLCSGNCEPCGDVTLGVGQLNFTAFINWTVTANHVDLIGKNVGGTPLFDFLPGHGLYVDLCGSGAGNDLGIIRSNLIPVTSEKDFEVILSIAGNQREAGTDTVRVKVYAQDGVTVLADEVITITNYTQDFTDYTIACSSSGGITGFYIEIQQMAIRPAGTGVFGNLLDSVTLNNVTDMVQLFFDNFDADNPTFIDPGCCYGDDYCAYGYGIDYCCYGNGCLDSPVPGQSEDEDALPDLEDDVIPPDDPPPPEVRSDNIASLDFRQTGPTTKSGAAVVGVAGDFWNTINFTVGGVAHGVGTDTILWGNGADSLITYAESLELSALSIFDGGVNTAHSDAMMRRAGTVINDGRIKEIRFGVPRGIYDVYVYGHGNADGNTMEVTLSTPLTNYGTKSTENSATWLPGFTEDKGYVKFENVVFAAIEATDMSLSFALAQASYLNGIQLHKKG